MPPGRGKGKGDWKSNGGDDRGGGGGKGSRYQRQQSKGGGRGGTGGYANNSQAARLAGGGRKESAVKAALREQGDALDKRFGYDRYSEGPPRLGWIFNMLPTSIPDAAGNEKSGLDMYFLEQDGGTFKATVFYKPYFYVLVKEERYIQDCIQCIRRRFEDSAVEVTVVDKEDLDMPNHLSGKLRRYLKLSFHSVADLMEVKKALMPTIQANKTRAEAQDAYSHTEAHEQQPDDFLSVLVDAREYDVPYYVRCSIDLDIRVGAWYMVTPQEEGVDVAWQKEMVDKAEPKVLAYDIECTKAPLKFPNVEIDQVFMISYMVDGQGFLIISREVVSEDVENFEYTPKPTFPGPFHIFNEPNEEAVIKRFFAHVAELRPQIIVTYNGDYFDWPFVDERAKGYGLDMEKEIGVGLQANGEYRGRCVAHMDAIYWVKRDSYLPQGSHGLKAVTKYKLGYDPVEVDPEDMVRYASERPTEMAAYSVSDAVATYYLYQTYVHMFVFSLCTIIPMGPDDVLRKGSGTLCEALLMVEAFRGNIVCPNKHSEPLTKFHDGHLVESETYIGGHVECLETGVFRSDLPEKFRLVPSALQALIDNVDRDLTFAIEVESGVQRDTVSNYDEVRSEIIEQLEMLRDSPLREEEPFIYHLDVAAMYPNIILSNRLQPGAIVNKATCASCDFNQESNNCKRALTWKWRGDMTPASRTEYQSVKMQLTYENVDGKPFVELDEAEQASNVKARLKNYAHKVYKKTKITMEEERVDTVCMRENPFYVNTVRAFRDRRYDYKIMTKKAKKAKAKAAEEGDAVAAKEAGDRAQVFDSLQLAHKCILNSFYGYVMRKGARWRSMEMAGIVTYTGALLIKQARELVEQIGRPLELDTDGIWCILPSSFPENFTFKTKSGGKIRISYPCVMLNADVHENYTNHQYQDLQDPATRKYNTKSECSIFFEVDGPYRCMVLPSSTEEGKLLKKRYAVFNHDGSLAELKGFELKRRGELEVIKVFQSQVFEKFLRGATLAECYNAVGEVANQWLDVLYSKGGDVDDDELMELISQNKTMSQTLEDYGTAKGTSQTTARRLADFLGAEMVKDKGLNCRMILSNRPHGAPVTDRAVPTAIFSAEPAVKKHYLRKWLKDPAMEDFDIRGILDWDYYLDRLGNCIRKIITIPAAMQKVPNPCPRVKHPDWLRKIVREINDGYRQTKIDQLFKTAPSGKSTPLVVEIRPSDKPGSFTVFAMTGPGDMQVIPITIPRVFYVNCLEDKGPAGGTSMGRRVARTLPNGHASPFLHEVAMDEAKFQRNEKQVEDFLHHAGIEGVYELGTPLVYRAILHLGSVARVVQGRAAALKGVRSGAGQAAGFELDDLELVTAAAHPYLHPSVATFKHIYLYHSTSGKRGMVGLFYVQGTNEDIEPEPSSLESGGGGVGGDEELGPGERPVIAKAVVWLVNPFSRRDGEQKPPFARIFEKFTNNPDSSCTFKTSSVGSIDEAWAAADASLASYSRQRNGPTVVLSQGLVQGQVHLGGAEGDDNDIWAEDLASPTILQPGAYRNICIELEIHGLAVGSVIASSQLEALEGSQGVTALTVNNDNEGNGGDNNAGNIFGGGGGGGSGGGGGGAGGGGGDDQAVASAFRILKVLVTTWLDEVTHMGNAHADSLLVHFYRWICARQSLLHNAALHRLVHRLMHKVFSRLIAELRRLGACVVFASFQKVIIATNKSDVKAARDYAKFVVSTVTSRDLFNTLQLEPKKLWEQLLFLDDQNYGGIQVQGSLFGEDGGDEAVPQGDDDADVDADEEATARKRNSRSKGEGDDLEEESEEEDPEGLQDSEEESEEEEEEGEGEDEGARRKRRLRRFKEGGAGGRPSRKEETGPKAKGDSDLKADDDDDDDAQVAAAAAAAAGANEGAGDTLADRKIPPIVSHWNLAEYLPASVRQVFLILVSTFLLKPHEKARQLRLDHERMVASLSNQLTQATQPNGPASPDGARAGAEGGAPAGQGGVDTALAVQAALRQEEANESQSMADFLKDLVSMTLTDKVLETVPAIKKYSGSGPDAFPNKPGASRELTNPALEFIKSLCHVLSLDPTVTDEVETLRKQALAEVGVRQFSAEGLYSDPCVSFVLPDVICTFCNLCRDLDLCRDSRLMDEDEEERWQCIQCNHPYERSSIELSLVEAVQRRSVRYQLQDMRCSKCGSVATRAMGLTCPCSGPLVAEESQKDFHKTMHLLRQLALFHNFGWLLETVEHILVADGQMDARREEEEEEEEEEQGVHGEEEGDAMQEDA
eukprot:g2319.t1